MSKYSKANRFLEREAFKASHKVILNHNDQTLISLASIASERFNIPKKELIQQFVRHCYAIRKATTYYLKTNILISDVALLFNVNKNRLNKHILILEKIDC